MPANVAGTALIKRPSDLLERRELPALTIDGAIDRGWHPGEDGRLLVANEPEFLVTYPLPGFSAYPAELDPGWSFVYGQV